MSQLFREFLDKLAAAGPTNPNLADLQDLPPIDELTDREREKLTNVGTRALTMPLYPVSAVGEALRYWRPDMALEDFVGSQEWAQSQLGGDPDAPENLFADFGTPDPLDAARLARYAPELAMVLFHGSPHKWDRVDLSKIGTGEGAQAYGHGFYAAERPGVAKDYQNRLSGRQQMQKATYQGTTAQERAFTWWDADDAYNERAERLEEALKWMRAKISYRLSGKVPDDILPDKDALREVIVKRELDAMDDFADGAYDAGDIDIDPKNFTAEEYLNYRKANLDETIAWHQFNIDEMQAELDTLDPGNDLYKRQEYLEHHLRLSKHKQNIAREQLAVVDEMNPADISVPHVNKGYFYELEVPDEAIDEMLLWDEPVSVQPTIAAMLRQNPEVAGIKPYTSVKEIPIHAIPDNLWQELQVRNQLSTLKAANADELLPPDLRQKLLDHMNEKHFETMTEGMTGERFYRRVAENLTPKDEHGRITSYNLNQPAATEFLRGQGIPGIKYRDFTRNRDSGPKTHNYVIFDDKLVDVLSRTQ